MKCEHSNLFYLDGKVQYKKENLIAWCPHCGSLAFSHPETHIITVLIPGEVDGHKLWKDQMAAGAVEIHGLEKCNQLGII